MNKAKRIDVLATVTYVVIGAYFIAQTVNVIRHGGFTIWVLSLIAAAALVYGVPRLVRWHKVRKVTQGA